MPWARTTTGTDTIIGYIESSELNSPSINVGAAVFNDSSAATQGTDYAAVWASVNLVITQAPEDSYKSFKWYTDSYRFGSYRFVENFTVYPYHFIDQVDMYLGFLRFWTVRNTTNVIRQSALVVNPAHLYRLDYFGWGSTSTSPIKIWEQDYQQSVYGSKIDLQLLPGTKYKYRLEYLLQTRLVGTLSPANNIILMPV